MMDLYRNKYRSVSIRMKNWDYGSPGYYYVTICTKDRRHFFGEVVACDYSDPSDYLVTPRRGDAMCGGIAGTHNYASLPPGARAAHSMGDQKGFGAVVNLTPIGKTACQNWLDIPQHFPFVSLDEFIVMPNHLHGILCFTKPGYRERKINCFGPQSQNLGSVIRNFKGATKAYATTRGIEFAWQARYHDDVVTSGKELKKIRAYIKNNPKRWIEKK